MKKEDNEDVGESTDSIMRLEEQLRAGRYVMRIYEVQYSLSLTLQNYVRALSSSMKHPRVKNLQHSHIEI